MDALADCIRVQRVDVLVGRTANQVVGAVAGNLRDPEVGAEEPRSVQLAEVEGGERKESGDTGLKPARQRDRLVTETKGEQGIGKGAWQPE